MENIKQPPPLLLTGDLKDNFKRFKQKFLLYYKACGIERNTCISSDEKLALLLHIIGDEALDVYNTFEFTDIKPTVDVVLQKFEDYCTPVKNETMARHIFFKREKKDTESFDEFITALKLLSAECGFGELKDGLLRDQIIRGIKDSNLQERLLKEQNLSLEKCTQLCKAVELASSQVKKLKDEEFRVEKIEKKK